MHPWTSIDSLRSLFILSVLISVGVTLPLQNLKGHVGREVTLLTNITGLQGDFSVVWTIGTNKETLISNNGGHIGLESESFKGRLKLDTSTGSLTIEQLRIEDSGVFEGTITDGNNNISTFFYHVTVSESQSPGSPNSAHCWRAQLTLILTAVCTLFL